jgi:hypothetical protein
MLRRLLVVLLALTFGCVTPSAIRAGDPLVAYYGAIADYNGAKRIALSYVLLADTSKAQAEAVVAAVQRADAELKRVDMLRAECEATATGKADAMVPDVGAELTADQFSDAFRAARSVAFSSCIPQSRLEAVARLLTAISAELRARALKGN